MTWYHVAIVGSPWMGETAATSRTFVADSDADAIAHVETGAEFGDFSDVEGWELTTRGGTDSFGRVVRAWDSEDVEATYVDCMFGSEDDDDPGSEESSK